MAILGLILLIIGLLAGISILFWLGLVLLVVGLVLHFAHTASPYGRHWY